MLTQLPLLHATTLASCLAFGWGIAVLALYVAPKLSGAGDRRAFHQLALFAPLLALGLAGTWSGQMALTGCPMFTPWDGGATLALLGGVAALVAIALVDETLRIRKIYRQLNQIADEGDGAEKLLTVPNLAERVGVRSPRVRLLATARPLACVAGVVRPTLFVSQGMLALLSERELEGLLAHELAHLRHQDNLLGWLDAVLFRAFRFLRPLRRAWAESLAEREEFADAVAARATGRPRALASALLKVAATPASADMAGLVGFAGQAGHIERRIERLLQSADVPGRNWGWPAVTALSIALALPFLTAWTLGHFTSCLVHLPGGEASHEHG